MDKVEVDIAWLEAALKDSVALSAFEEEAGDVPAWIFDPDAEREEASHWESFKFRFWWWILGGRKYYQRMRWFVDGWTAYDTWLLDLRRGKITEVKE